MVGVRPVVQVRCLLLLVVCLSSFFTGICTAAPVATDRDTDLPSTLDLLDFDQATYESAGYDAQDVLVMSLRQHLYIQLGAELARPSSPLRTAQASYQGTYQHEIQVA